MGWNGVESLGFKKLIREIPDFPKPGIQFKDITTLLRNGPAFRAAIDGLADRLRPLQPEVIVGPEARGFVLGSAVAYHLGLGIVPVRKRGKLPARTLSVTYALEYGEDELQVHADAIDPGQRVAIVDDLLATGGTIEATARLVEQAGGRIVGFGFLIELTFLDGRRRLRDRPVHSLITY